MTIEAGLLANRNRIDHSVYFCVRLKMSKIKKFKKERKKKDVIKRTRMGK